MLRRNVVAVFAASLMLSACQVELYTQLSEKEANEMIAVLLNGNIEADKLKDKDGLVSLMIAEDDFANAMAMLQNKGLPRTEFTNIGEVYKKEGLISSPAEERARFLFARSQELSATLTELEGVISARVHIAIPEQKSLVSKPEPPSASVWIWHQQSAMTDALVPQIKTAVAFSVEELEYSQVSVFLNSVQGEAERVQRLDSPTSIGQSNKNELSQGEPTHTQTIAAGFGWQSIIAGLVGVLGVLLLGLTALFFRRSSKQDRDLEVNVPEKIKTEGISTEPGELEKTS